MYVQYNRTCVRILIRVDSTFLDSDRIRNADQDLVAMKLICINKLFQFIK
jgi:hypothetical protein